MMDLTFNKLVLKLQNKLCLIKRKRIVNHYVENLNLKYE